jgi:hypothetical protein
VNAVHDYHVILFITPNSVGYEEQYY